MLRHEVSHDEVNDPVGVTLTIVLEIDTVVRRVDLDGFIVSAMLHNKLLHEQEGALVRHTLPHLD